MACFNLFELGISGLNQEEAGVGGGGNDGPITFKEPDPLESHHHDTTTGTADDSNINSNSTNTLAFGKFDCIMTKYNHPLTHELLDHRGLLCR